MDYAIGRILPVVNRAEFNIVHVNTADLEKYVREMARIGEQNAPLAKALLEVELFLAEHWLPILLFSVVWYALHLHATWTNLRGNTGTDRLTWLVAIWLPSGLIFYWILGRPSTDGSATVAASSPPPPAPLKSERETAADITAALAAESRRRGDRQP